jgi:hypothetical protein
VRPAQIPVMRIRSRNQQCVGDGVGSGGGERSRVCSGGEKGEEGRERASVAAPPSSSLHSRGLLVTTWGTGIGSELGSAQLEWSLTIYSCRMHFR